jgi:ATP-dependent DNA helicase RecQ
VLVSTMHKAKGKEFDHVFLLLRNYPLRAEANKRVVYVAITRAKQSLHIHTDQSYFNHINVPQLKKVDDDNIYPAPLEIQIEPTMKDVWLGFFMRHDTIKAIKPLQACTALQVSQVPTEGLTVSSTLIVVFSQKFKKELARLFSQGYSLQHAEIAHIVVWYCEDDGKEYRDVLPRLYLQK